MPELPEVETIRRGLDELIKGAKIKRVKILCEKSFIGPKEKIEHQEIISLQRRGKALLINLSNNMTLLIHLRMTGQLIFRGNNRSETNFAGGHPTDSFINPLPDKQTRVIIELENGTLYFNDQRKFGFIKLLETSTVDQDQFIRSLAKEPWDISSKEFKHNLLRHKNSKIKPVILDQKVIAGIGNIYADEVLFFAKIHPERLVATLSDSEIQKLLKGIQTVMQASIDSGGSTMRNYVKADGTKGDYLKLFAQVFHREGEECLRCKAKIIKTKVAGRGTHLCPNCQRIEKI